ncbi:MAG TPA: hypothetical protein VFZ75_12625 [Actinomycetota bacterium]|nr:hypothetical protein [Actinomycetota bacterium]
MTGVAGVMALVLAEATAGATLFLWVSPLWGEVKRGFFKLVGAILTIVGLLTWFSVDAAVVARFASGDALRVTTAIAAGATALWTVLLFARQPAAARVIGWLSVPAWLAVVAWMGGAGRQDYPLALFQLAAGAALLGSATDGLLLGHWYLTDRKLPRRPIERITTILLVSVVLAAVSVLSAGFSGVESSISVNPLLTAGALAPWIALGMVAATALIAVLVKAALRGERPSGVQSATGFYYLAVVTAFTAEVAAKTRFLDPSFG